MPDFKRQNPIPMAPNADMGLDSQQREVMRFSTRDLYCPESEVLLLRAGQQVDDETLHRLSKFGIKDAVAYAQPDPTPTMRRPATPLKTQEVSILILAPETRDLDRMTQCLMACDVTLNRIHPVRVLHHLPWAAKKYQPEVLVMDFVPTAEGWEILDTLCGLPFVQKIILTLDSAHVSASLLQGLQDPRVRVLSKPINRFGLRDALQA